MADPVERLERRVARERAARKEAEQLLETKSREVFEAKEALEAEYLRVARKNSEIELLHEIVFAGSDGLTLASTLQHFVDAVCAMTSWPVAHATVPDSEDPNLLVSREVWYFADADHADLKARICATSYKKGEGILGEVFESGELRFLRDPGAIERIGGRIGLEVEGGLLVPVVVEGDVVAVVEFYIFTSSETDDRYVDTVGAAARQLGSLLEKQKAQRELESSYEQLKQAQAQLVQSEKLASIGQLAAGVAHEINNPMGFVTSNLNSLREYYGEISQGIEALKRVLQAVTDASPELAEVAQAATKVIGELDLEFTLEDTSELIAETIEGGERIRKIVADLKDFSHVDAGAVNITNVNELIEKTLSVARNELKYVATLETQFSELPEIPCFGGKLGQVILNLLVNAAHAMKGQNGNVWVRTSHDAEWVYVEVEDSGCGIPEENITKIFDPFFTTKEVGEGTGLGLNLSYNIMEAHGGGISVSSVVGTGTKFLLKLPIAGPPSESSDESIDHRIGEPA